MFPSPPLEKECGLMLKIKVVSQQAAQFKKRAAQSCGCRGAAAGSGALVSKFGRTTEVCLNSLLAAVFVDIREKGEITSKTKPRVLTKYTF